MKLWGRRPGSLPKHIPKRYHSGVRNLRGALFGCLGISWDEEQPLVFWTGFSWIFSWYQTVKNWILVHQQVSKNVRPKETGWIVCFVYPDVCQVNWMLDIRSIICVSFSSYFALLETIIKQIGVKELALLLGSWQVQSQNDKIMTTDIWNQGKIVHCLWRSLR